jgi:aldehyde dehydrogenase (NAD+)
MSDIVQLENIVRGVPRRSEQRRQAGRFSFPVTTEQDVSFALKSLKAQRPNSIRAVIKALSKIGREGSWIRDEDLVIQAELSGSPIKHMRKSIAAVNGWLTRLDEYVQSLAQIVTVSRPPAEDLDVLMDRDNCLYRGGLSTMFVLAGDEIAIAPWNIAQALLANAAAVVKPSKIEPLGAYLFTRALAAEGITPPALLYISRDTEGEKDLVGRLIGRTQQSVIFGEDHTVSAICEPFGYRAGHKSLVYLTGRSGAIVWPDADIELAAEMIIRGATDDRGNRCNSTKKVYAPKSLAKQLEAALVRHADKLVRGEPNHPDTDLGRNDPQARVTARECAASGSVFYERDLFLLTVPTTAGILKEEVPYPTVAVCYYEAGTDPVELANESVADTPLGASIATAVFTRDEARFLDTASRLLTCKALFNTPSTEFDFWATHQARHLFLELMRKTELIGDSPASWKGK